MDGLILGLWIVTMIAGGYMFTFTSGAGRPGSTARATSLPPLLLFVHPTLAFLGIALWLAHMYLATTVLPWLALAELVVAAVIGDVLAARTLRRDPAKTRIVVGAARGDAGDHARAEDQIPHLAIATHGLLAGVLIVLVLLVALGVLG